MVTTTLAAVALAGALASGATPTPVGWQTDYGAGMTVAASQQKPMAVVVGHGPDGFTRVLNGTLSGDATRLLADSYVCVYVNADTADGRRLAAAMGVVAEGLVISSRGGQFQALRHDGTVSPTQLDGYLTKYADPNRVVTVTEKAGAIVSTSYSVPASAPVTVGTPVVTGTVVYPSGVPAMNTFYPTPVFQSAPMFPANWGFSSGVG